MIVNGLWSTFEGVQEGIGILLLTEKDGAPTSPCA